MKLRQYLPFFSYVFHPIFISLYGSLFYFLTTPTTIFKAQIYYLLIQISILTVLLPLALFFLMVSLGSIHSFTEATTKERKIPILIQAILLLILLKFSNTLVYLPDLYYFFTGGLISALLAFFSAVINYKSSLHMIGITSLATFIYLLNLQHEMPFINSVAFSFVSVGLVASSRLYMKSHTVNELLVGSLIGIIPQLTLWYFNYKM